MPLRIKNLKEAQQLGLGDQLRQAQLQPASARMTRRHRVGPDFSRILAVTLQERFPGIFTPIPALGIHWGNPTRKLGIQWGGIVPTEALQGWTIVPVWWGDLHVQGTGQFSQRKLNAVMQRIAELLKEG